MINPATVSGAERRTWLAAKIREQAKRLKYGPSVQAMERKLLRTAVIESTGALGQDLSRVIHELDKIWTERGLQLPETTTWTSSFSEYWRQRISVSLVKGAGEMRDLSQNAARGQEAQRGSHVDGQHSRQRRSSHHARRGAREERGARGHSDIRQDQQTDRARQPAKERVAHSTVDTARTLTKGPAASAPQQDLPRQSAEKRVAHAGAQTARTKG